MADWQVNIRGTGNADQAMADIAAFVQSLEASGQTIHGAPFNSSISQEAAQPILDRREAERAVAAEAEAKRQADEVKAAADAAIEAAKGKPE